jgi:hypothetical protein
MKCGVVGKRAPRIPHLGTGRRWVVKFDAPASITPGKRDPCAHWRRLDGASEQVCTWWLGELRGASSWEANSRSVSQEITRLLWNPKTCHFHKTPPLVYILNQVYLVHSLTLCFTFILILSTHQRLGVRSGLFPSGFPTEILYAFFFVSPVLTTCPAHFILPYLMTVLIFGEFSIWSSCCFF